MNELVKKFIIIFIIMGPCLIFGFLGKPTEMGLIIIASSITAAFINIDKIKKFKGAGFEAEMQKVVDEAYASIAQVREITCATAEVSLSHLIESCFWGNLSFNKKLNLHDNLIDKLKNIKATDQQIQNVNKIWNKGILIIYHRGLKNQIKQDFNPSQEIIDEFDRLQNFELFEIKSLDIHKNFILDKGLINDKIEHLLNDFKYFEQTNEILNKDEFIKL